MGRTTGIEWTDATFSPWRGCTKDGPDCKFCYAETLADRFKGNLGVWGPKGARVMAAEAYWGQPLRWEREALLGGRRTRVFCASLADVFERPETMPEADREAVHLARVRLFALIYLTPSLDWQVLTKRPDFALELLGARSFWSKVKEEVETRYKGKMMGEPGDWASARLSLGNLWLGTSAGDQETYDRRVPGLLRLRPFAPVLFLSAEPLIGRIALNWGGGLDWVIAGGESGQGARPTLVPWVEGLRDECARLGVAFFFKQWGEWLPDSQNPDLPELQRVQNDAAIRVGKEKAGRLLNGLTYSKFPSRRVEG